MKRRVLTALEPRHEASLVAHLGALDAYDLVRRCPDLADLLAAGAAGLADLALVSAGLRGLDRDSVAHLHEAGVQVVGLGSNEAQEKRLRQLGVDVALPADCGAAELDAALRAAPHARLGSVDVVDDGHWAAIEAGLDPAGDPTRAPRADPEPESLDEGDAAHHGSGRIVAVWGPTGAPGRTSLAVNLAGEVALAGITVLLVDADTYGASIGQHLGLLDEAPGLAAAARAAELGTLDVPVLARLTPRVDPGFRVLTGLPSAARWPEVRADAMEHILRLARQLAEIVVVDCGFCLEDDEELSYDTRAPRRNATTLVVLRAADEVLVVGAGDPVGLQRLVRAVTDLGASGVRPPRIVVNKLRSSAAGPAPERSIAQTLERFAALDVEHFIPADPQAFDTALLAGRILFDVAPKSPARQRIATLARQLATTEPTSVLADRSRGRATAWRRWPTLLQRPASGPG